MSTTPATAEDPQVQKINEVATSALSVTQKAKSLAKIETADQYKEAVEFGKTLSAKIKEVTDFFNPMREAAHKAWKAITTRQGEVIEPLEDAKKQLGISIFNFEQEQERIRREKEREIQAQIEKQAEDEKVEVAAQLELEGRHDEAQEVLESQPVVMAPAVVQREVPKASGVSSRITYKAEVTSLMQLVRAVAEGKVPVNAIKADEVFLNQQARSMKASLNYPGVKVVQIGSTAFRA